MTECTESERDIVRETNTGNHDYWLPDHADPTTEIPHQSQVNSVVFIGANGSGKTRLGVWMEQRHPDKVRRITALRNLTFAVDLPAEGLEQARNTVWYARANRQSNHDRRYQWNGERYDYSASLVSDFDHVLATIIAQQNADACSYLEKAKIQHEEGLDIEPPEEPTLDKMQRIWGAVFPQIQLNFADTRVSANRLLIEGAANAPAARSETTSSFPAREMSDGERAGLYLIAQALCIETGNIVLIDEPELHLHPSVMACLWNAIESQRPDCLFIYFTHDTAFADSRMLADKYWVRGFDGSSWKVEKLSPDTPLEPLMLEILGSRKPVLLVEGDLDGKLYSFLFPEYHVVRCDGCESVIRQVKAFRNLSALHRHEITGLIDRDRRSEDEITSLRKDGVNTLRVAEVENLFLLEDVFAFLGSYLQQPDSAASAKKFVTDTKFGHLWKKLAREHFGARVRHLLEGLQFEDGNVTGIQSKLQEFGETLAALEEKTVTDYETVANSGSYDDILRLLNVKDVIKEVGTYFGLTKGDNYINLILRLLEKSGDEARTLRTAMRTYIPVFTDDIRGKTK